MNLTELEVFEYMAKHHDMVDYSTVSGFRDDAMQLAKAYRKVLGLPPATYKNPWPDTQD